MSMYHITKLFDIAAMAGLAVFMFALIAIAADCEAAIEWLLGSIGWLAICALALGFLDNLNPPTS